MSKTSEYSGPFTAKTSGRNTVWCIIVPRTPWFPGRVDFTQVHLSLQRNGSTLKPMAGLPEGRRSKETLKSVLSKDSRFFGLQGTEMMSQEIQLLVNPRGVHDVFLCHDVIIRCSQLLGK